MTPGTVIVCRNDECRWVRHLVATWPEDREADFREAVQMAQRIGTCPRCGDEVVVEQRDLFNRTSRRVEV